MPLAVHLVVSATVIEAGDKPRSKLPINSDTAETTEGFSTLYAALEVAGLEATFKEQPIDGFYINLRSP